MSAIAGMLQSIHSLVAQGNGAEAREKLQGLRGADIPRADRAAYAQLCWRTGLTELGLSSLAPCLRSEGRSATVASSAERAEHAQCLIRAGAPAEALAILRDVDAREYPRAHLYLASARIAHWDYSGSIAPLEAFLASTAPRSYDRLIARVNLAAALAHEGDGRLVRVGLRTAALEAANRRATVLHASALEIEAQILLDERRFAEALALIDRAAQILGAFGAADEWYTRKWRAIARLREERSESAAREAHRSAREEALRRGSWESARQLDGELALRLRDDAIYRAVYFGTPYPCFRRKLAAKWSEAGRAETAWECELREGAGAGLPVLDVSDGSYGNAKLNAAKRLHRLLFTLAADRYRPQTPAALFFAIFPGEVYHPRHGKQRVHQAISALRRWIGEAGAPLDVAETGGAYRLEGSCRLRLPAWSPFDEGTWRGEVARHKLRALAADAFTSSEAQAAIGLSRRTTLRILSEGLREGWLAREGNRRSSRYRFATPAEGEEKQ